MASSPIAAVIKFLGLGIYPPGTDTMTARRCDVLQVFIYIGSVPLLLFGLVNLSTGNQVTGTVELFVTVLLLITLVRLRQHGHYRQAGNVTLSLLSSILLLLLITGGLEHTGIFWFFTFPIVAYFITGKREGTLWILGLLAAILALHIGAHMDLIRLSYTTIEIRQLIACLIALSCLIYAYYHYIHEQDQDVLVRRENELLERNRQLREQVKQQEEVQLHQRDLIETIDKTITEVQTKNADLEHAKLAMMNVLEDLEVERRRTLENERKVEAILASIGEGIIATDSENTIIVANEQAMQLLGFSSKELLGASYFKRVIPVTDDGKVVPLADRPFSRSLQSGQPVSESSFSYVRKDGSTIPVSITASPVQVGKKQIGGIVVFRDITKERQIDKAKTEFVSLASHQLRTPLSAIGWYIEMLLSGDAGKLAKQQLEYLKEIQHGSKRLVNMVNSLLNVSRIELGTFMVEPTPTKPAEIANSVLDEVKALVVQKQFKVVKRFAKNIPVMKLDAHLLEIIMQNLVSNAVKYTPEKGTITVSMRLLKNALQIKVADTGIGIPKDQQGRIFEKLFRADNVRATDTDGTGLGLYMVKQILDEIGGSITLESVLKKGTTMTISLPLTGMKAKKGSRRLS